MVSKNAFPHSQCRWNLAAIHVRIMRRYGILQQRAFTQAIREKLPLIINFTQIVGAVPLLLHASSCWGEGSPVVLV